MIRKTSIPQALKHEHAIPSIQVWLKQNQCSLVMPEKVYFKGNKVGTLNVVDDQLVYIPAITWDEWAAVERKHPVANLRIPGVT